MLMRTHGDIQKRAADLHSKVSSLVQEISKIDDELAKIHCMGYEDENYPGHNRVIQLNKSLAHLESDRHWMETTLEALEWALGETEVKPEEVLEEEWKMKSGPTTNPITVGETVT